MIPLKLELTNFLSYRETAVLDFSGVHLACISGANGAGKSSLLDAMTWVLFGQSRSRSDDDLVNRLAALDGAAAEVRLIFDLEGAVYRVMRRKAVGKTVVLELQMAAGDDRWKTLSEGGVRQTQAAIETLLRMSYDTFINASFLLQGKADEFTTKTPNRRKEILIDLLGLQQWELYKGRAGDSRKEAQGRVALLEAQLAEVANELDQEAERQETLAGAQAELETVAARLADKEALLTQARKVQTAIDQQKRTVHDLTNRLEQARRRQTQVAKTLADRRQQQADQEALLAEADAIEAAHAQWQAAETALQAWQAKADTFNQLTQAKRPFDLAITQARTRLEQRQKELENQQQKVTDARQERETMVAQIEKARQELEQLQAARAQLQSQEEAWQEARSELQRLTGEQKLRRQELTQLHSRAERMAQLADEQTAVVKNLAEAQTELKAVSDELDAITERTHRHATLLADHSGLEAEQGTLRDEMERLRARIEQLQEGEEGTCPVCGQTLTAEHRQTVLADLRQEGRDKGDRFRANKEKLAALMVEIETLSDRLKRRDRVEKEKQVQQERQVRAEARLDEIQQTLSEWIEAGKARLAELETLVADDGAIVKLKEQVARLATAVNQKSELDKQHQEAQRRLSNAEARLAEIDRLLAEWDERGQAALAAVKKQLADGDYAADAQTELKELETKITAVEYDAEAHAAARKERQALAAAPARRQKLQEVRAAMVPLADAIADLETQQTDQAETVAALAAQLSEAEKQMTALTTDAGDLRAIEDEVQQLREQRIAADRRVGAAQQRLAVLDDVRQRQSNLQAALATTRQRVQRLKLLEEACGRNGVQGLLIEHALPEIEEQANELLERLTGGTMRISFETQRQLKSRDELAETLDIRIIDNAGERPYDNYSGGEQFRVNFAVRLALSQLLARRAGARLQTLVIDEGFGSQDPNGRQRLVEAINTIQDDFVRILVITHIDELRDAFPTRIEVEKRPSGSLLEVI